MVADDVPSQLVYEEIRDVPALQTMSPEAAVTRNTTAPNKLMQHPYEDVEAAGLQAAAETGAADSYHFTLCSAYGVSKDSQQ